MGFMGNMLGNKALAAHGKGDYNKALEIYDQAYEKGMDKFRLLRGYCVLLIRTCQFDKALEVLKKLDKMTTSDPKDKVDVHVNYAIILWKKGHLDRALQILEDEFRHTKNGTMYSIIGYLKIEQGNLEEALRFNHEALDYDEDDAVFLDNLGQTYYRLAGDKATAKTYFDRAIARKPNAIDTNYFLAQYAIENGNKAEAIDRLNLARKGFFSPLNYAQPDMIDQQLAELGQ